MLSDSKTLRPVIALYAAQVLNLLFGWIITKLNISQLSVDEFGQFTFFITLINSSFIFFSFGVFEVSSRLMALSESKKHSDKTLTVSLTFALLSYVLFTLFFWLTKSLILKMFSINVYGLVKSYFALAGMYLLYDFWQKILRGGGKIYRLSWFLILPRLIYIAVLLFLFQTRLFDLKTTTMANLISFGLVFILFVVPESLNFEGYFVLLKSFLREIRRFGIHMYWAELIQAFLFYIDKLFIGYLLTSKDLAYYSLAFTIAFPLSFFSTSLATGMYRDFSKAKEINNRIIRVNLIWILISLLALIFTGSWIVKHIFSAKYTASLPVLIPLAIAFGVSGLSKIYTYFLIARGEGRIIRNISVLLIIVNIILNIFLIPSWGIVGSAYARIVTFMVDFVCMYSAYKLLIKRLKQS